jgi:hypothetical protein
MITRRKATVLISKATLEQAVAEGNAIANNLLETSPHDPRLDELSEAIGRLQGVLGKSQTEMQQEGVASLEGYLDNAKMPEVAEAIKRDVDLVAKIRRDLRPERIIDEVPMADKPVQAAGSGSENWTTDRNEKGEPKTPETAEVPRLAGKKKKEAETPVAEAAPAVTAPAVAPPAAGTVSDASVLEVLPTEFILKMVEDLPKQEGFQENKQLQDALIRITEILKSRPVVPEVAPEAAAAPKAAASKEPFGGKQAPPFGSKEKDEKKEASAEKKADGQIYEVHPNEGAPQKDFVKNIPQSQGAAYKGAAKRAAGADAPASIAGVNSQTPDPQSAFVAEIPQSQGAAAKSAGEGVSRKEERVDDVPIVCTGADKTAVAPPGWEDTVKDMKKEKDIDNPWALAWSMKNKGYTPHAGRWLVKRKGAAYVMKKFSGGGTSGGGAWTADQSTGDIETGAAIPEVSEAHGKRDDNTGIKRPETTLPMRLSSEMTTGKALKLATDTQEKLKGIYLESKQLTTANNTQPVRAAVELVYAAFSAFDGAVKAINKQKMQEEQEAEAMAITEKKKKSSFGGLTLATAE